MLLQRLDPSTKVMVLKNRPGSFGVTGVKKVIFTKKASNPSDYVALTRALCTCSSLAPKLCQNHQWGKGYKSYQQFYLKGQVGVTGVKNVKNVCYYGKCYSSYMLHSRVTWLKYIDKLETLYKTFWFKFRFGVIWGHRDQKFIFTKKMFLLIQYTLYGHVTHAYKQAWDPLQQLLSEILPWGLVGSLGSKIRFSLVLYHVL